MDLSDIRRGGGGGGGGWYSPPPTPLAFLSVGIDFGTVHMFVAMSTKFATLGFRILHFSKCISVVKFNRSVHSLGCKFVIGILLCKVHTCSPTLFAPMI